MKYGKATSSAQQGCMHKHMHHVSLRSIHKQYIGYSRSRLPTLLYVMTALMTLHGEHASDSTEDVCTAASERSLIPMLQCKVTLNCYLIC
jgi:hypothetical protein